MLRGRVSTRAPSLRLACTAALVGCALFALPGHADPILTRNQHPLTSLFGLPAPLPARLAGPGGGHAALTLNWASFAVAEDRGASSMTLDGETVDVRVRVDHALAPRWAWHAELGWRDLSGGSLDSVVDTWHDWFGLGGGARNRLPRDQLLIEYVDDGVTRLRIDEGGSGIADLPLSVGYQLVATEQAAVATWLTVKLPTGDSERLSGSGATDVALSFSASRELSGAWQVFGQASLAWLGTGDVLAELQEDYAGSLLSGVTWRPTGVLELTAQVEANTAVTDTGTDLDGDAVVLTLGGALRTSGGWRFDLGFSEDLNVNASPDFVIVAGVGRSFGPD
jgi:hypothetical protein